MTEKREFFELIHELLQDHARLFNYTFPHGFKKPELKDEDYSLDLRLQVLYALDDFIKDEETNGDLEI